jgi:hypothetical protein
VLDLYTSLQNKHPGKTATVLLNGPSLGLVPLDHIDGITFGSNKIYETWIPTYYVNNGDMNFATPDAIIKIMAVMESDKCKAAFINRLASHVFRHEKMFSIMSSSVYNGEPANRSYGYSFDPLVMIGVRGSVLYPIIQIADYMGFKRLNLVGFDYHYNEDGNYHFYPDDDQDRADPPPGRFYEDNDDWRATNDAILSSCKEIWEDRGKEIVNWTPSSRCEIFRMEEPPWHG